MKIYKELEKLGFFDWLSQTHELEYVDMNPEYLDNLPLNDIHITVCNATVFRWFRNQYDWQSSIEATSDQHSRKLGYNYWIWNHKTGEEHHTMPNNRPSGDWIFETYEEALEEGLQKALKLI
jgi:hypothetical protein